MEAPTLKPLQTKAVRWLSHNQACNTMSQILPCVVMSPKREASERNDPQALGLVRQVENSRFVACLHMLCDILPALSQLSKQFQVREQKRVEIF